MASFTLSKLLLIGTGLLALADCSVLPANRLFSRQSTPDGTCGLVESGSGRGYKCPTSSSKCCSQWGWCGDSTDHCGMPNHPFQHVPIYIYIYIYLQWMQQTNSNPQHRNGLSVWLRVLHWVWRRRWPNNPHTYPTTNWWRRWRWPPPTRKCSIRTDHF